MGDQTQAGGCGESADGAEVRVCHGSVLLQITGCQRTSFPLSEGCLQPDEPLQAEGHWWHIIPEFSHFEIQMHCIEKLHRAQGVAASS